MYEPSPASNFAVPAGSRHTDKRHSLEQQVDRLKTQLEHSRADCLAQLAEKEALTHRLRRVLNALPGAVVVLDGRGYVQEHNQAAAQLLGLPLQGELWRDLIDRCFVPQVGQGNDLTLRSGRIVILSTCPLGAEPGQTLLFQDVTESRQLQAQLDRQQRLLDMGRMAANLAHQIRTPLASALLYASQLKHPWLAEDKRERFAGKAVASLQQLERLISNMLLFARGGLSGEELLCGADLLHEMQSGLEAQMAGKQLECRFECGASDLMLRGNRTMLLSAWQNLANNAVQMLGPGGRMQVFCRPAAANSIELGVHDDGPGVPLALQEKLFEPFSTGRERGTGLGLAIVRAIARAHHGDAWFRSVPGDTTFAMRLPLAGSGTGAEAEDKEALRETA